MEPQTKATDAPVQPIVSTPTLPFEPYYRDDSVTIYNADCRKILPWLEKFDLLLTDPPYGIGGWSANHTGGFMSKDEAKKMSWDREAPPQWVLDACIESAKDCIIWGGNYMRLPPAGRVLVWDKEQKGMHFAEAEIAWTNWSTGTTRICTLGIKTSEVFGTKSERVHPTQKPVGLIQWCLGLRPDAKTVVDPFAGSGTTGVACKLEGRKAVLIEISEEYCEKAANRLRQGVLF